MKEREAKVREAVEAIFRNSAFVSDLGIELKGLGPGWCESALVVEKRHLQQDGFVHAGVQATIADHTAGGAAGTLSRPGEMVLTVEFKINLLRPAVGERLNCRAKVLKPGKTIVVAESEVFAARNGAEIMTAKATVTLALVLSGGESAGSGRPGMPCGADWG